MLEKLYEGLNTRPKVYLSKEYFCEMYPTCVSSKLCEFIVPQKVFLAILLLGEVRLDLELYVNITSSQGHNPCIKQSERIS